MRPFPQKFISPIRSFLFKNRKHTIMYLNIYDYICNLSPDTEEDLKTKVYITTEIQIASLREHKIGRAYIYYISAFRYVHQKCHTITLGHITKYISEFAMNQENANNVVVILDDNTITLTTCDRNLYGVILQTGINVIPFYDTEASYVNSIKYMDKSELLLTRNKYLSKSQYVFRFSSNAFIFDIAKKLCELEIIIDCVVSDVYSKIYDIIIAETFNNIMCGSKIITILNPKYGTAEHMWNYMAASYSRGHRNVSFARWKLKRIVFSLTKIRYFNSNNNIMDDDIITEILKFFIPDRMFTVSLYKPSVCAVSAYPYYYSVIKGPFNVEKKKKKHRCCFC